MDVSPPRKDDRKCYGQRCTVARALDIVGDRWTLLVLRELLGGPARFHELQAGLPGIAKNLLTDRLRRLETDGLVRRVRASTTTQYVLTELGLSTRPIVEALGMWGGRAPKLAPPEHDRSVRSIAVALHTFLTRGGQPDTGPREVVEVTVDDEPLEVVLGPEPRVSARPSGDPAARVSTTKATMRDYLQGAGLDRRAWRLESGDKEARARLLDTLAAMI